MIEQITIVVSTQAYSVIFSVFWLTIGVQYVQVGRVSVVLSLLLIHPPAFGIINYGLS